MAISNRQLVVAGATLTATYKGQRFTCEVSAGDDDKLVYRLGDGRSFSSSSSAGSAAKGGKSCNGFEFWSVAGDGPAAVAPPTEEVAKAAPEPKAPKAQG